MAGLGQRFAGWALRSHRRAAAQSRGDISRAAREVIGPQGALFSRAWEELNEHGSAYVESFDRRLPPSTFVSERDRRRINQPMPLVERCISDHRR